MCKTCVESLQDSRSKMTIEHELPFNHLQLPQSAVGSCKEASSGRTKMDLGFNLGSILNPSSDDETFEYRPRSYLGCHPGELMVDTSSPTFNKMLDMYEQLNVHVPGSKRSWKRLKARSTEASLGTAEFEKTPKWVPRLKATNFLSAPSSPRVSSHASPRSKSRSFTASSLFSDLEQQSPRCRSRPKARSFYFADQSLEAEIPKQLRLRSKSHSVIVTAGVGEEGDTSPRSRALSMMVNRLKNSMRKPLSLESLVGQRLESKSSRPAKQDGSLSIDVSVYGRPIWEANPSKRLQTTPALEICSGIRDQDDQRARKNREATIPSHSSDEDLYSSADQLSSSFASVSSECNLPEKRVFLSADSLSRGSCHSSETTLPPWARRASYSIFPKATGPMSVDDAVAAPETRQRQHLPPILFASMADIRNRYEGVERSINSKLSTGAQVAERKDIPSKASRQIISPCAEVTLAFPGRLRSETIL